VGPPVLGAVSSPVGTHPPDPGAVVHPAATTPVLGSTGTVDGGEAALDAAESPVLLVDPVDLPLVDSSSVQCSVAGRGITMMSVGHGRVSISKLTRVTPGVGMLRKVLELYNPSKRVPSLYILFAFHTIFGPAFSSPLCPTLLLLSCPHSSPIPYPLQGSCPLMQLEGPGSDGSSSGRSIGLNAIRQYIIFARVQDP